MEDFIDVDNIDDTKKKLEIDKLRKEIIKIDYETTEIKWKKWSAWGPTIIAICSLIFVWANGFLDAKSALVKAETLNLEGKRDALNLKIKNLNSKIDSLNSVSVFSISEIKRREEEIENLEVQIYGLQSKNSKYRQGIYRVEGQIKALNSTKDSLYSEISKVENCFPKAKEFLLQYCVITQVKSMSLDSVTSGINPPPYKTRFKKSLKEIASMDISSMDYIQFLKITANFKTIVKRFTINIISEDGLVSPITVVTDGAMTRVQGRREIYDTASKFECYKGLSTNQKLKLLNEVIIRKN